MNRGSRSAEVEVNKKLTILVNDKEHRAFKTACVSEGKEMAEVLRAYMREYVNGERQHDVTK